MKLEKKAIEYTGPEKTESISEIRVEIAGLKHLIQEAKAHIKAFEQLVIIFEEAQKEKYDENSKQSK